VTPRASRERCFYFAADVSTAVAGFLGDACEGVGRRGAADGAVCARGLSEAEGTSTGLQVSLAPLASAGLVSSTDRYTGRPLYAHCRALSFLVTTVQSPIGRAACGAGSGIHDSRHAPVHGDTVAWVYNVICFASTCTMPYFVGPPAMPPGVGGKTNFASDGG